jgi:Tol biopolymer transport system component
MQASSIVTREKKVQEKHMIFFASLGNWRLRVRGTDATIQKLSKPADQPTPLWRRAAALAISLAWLSTLAGAQKKEDKKEDKKKPAEALKVERLTQGMGLYAIGPLSPDRKSVLLLAHKPEQTPNLYVMNLTNRSIRPSLTNFRWGATDPAWSPDGQSVALAGFGESGSFAELYLLELKTGKLRQMTKNAFSDKEPVFAPDGKQIFYTTDESPLPDAAFGILHIASIAVAGGKGEAFTEDETSSIHPGFFDDGKSVLLVKVSEASGRHSLWQYDLAGKPLRDLTETKFARIHRYLFLPSGNSLVLWAQEEAEQPDNLFILDLKSGKVTDLPDPDQSKRSPALSADGKRIAFISPTDLGNQLFIYDSTTGLIQQLTYKPGNAHSPVFISDHEIMFGSDRDREPELYVIDLTPQAEKKK